ncbi:MAG: helix-hairpin-helix domain-containing protein, partial [Rhodomicrobium sp.]
RINACAAPVPEEEQRSRYLAGYRIESAKLTGIGPARCAVLRSWGVDTAADVEPEKIAAIPGFGKALTEKLVLWRKGLETGFVHSATATVDPLQVQAIDRELATPRTKLMKQLRALIAEAEQRMSGFFTERQALWAQVERTFEARMLARL